MSEHTPITGELREAVEWEPTFCGPDKAMVSQPEFDRICDAIDAVHAGLERDYKVACEVNERQDEQYADMVNKLDRAYEKNRNQRKQLTEVQEALHRRNEGELKVRWQKEIDRLERENAELRQRVAELDKRDDSMHDGGSITDELRDFAKRWPCTDYICKDMLAIADRIDEEYESAIQQALMDEGGVPATDENMVEHGWVRLPVDADGVPIRIGDAVTCGATVWTVTGLKFLGEGWGICCTVYNEYGGSGTSVYPPSDLRHHHAPTVEDVLREMLCAWEDTLTSEGVDGIIAEYATKLRLAGSDAE